MLQISPWPCRCWGPLWRWPQNSTQMAGWVKNKLQMTNVTMPNTQMAGWVKNKLLLTNVTMPNNLC